MNKNWIGGIGALLVVALIVWLIGGGTMSCKESFWDKDKTVIEITK